MTFVTGAMEALHRSAQESDEVPVAGDDHVPVQQCLGPNQAQVFQFQSGVEIGRTLFLDQSGSHALRVSNMFGFKQWLTA